MRLNVKTLSTATSEDLRIRSEGKAEIIERATARFERDARAFDEDQQRVLPALTTEERDAVDALERLEPGSSFVVAMRATQAKALAAAERWGERHGLSKDSLHFPIRLRTRTVGFGARMNLILGCAAVSILCLLLLGITHTGLFLLPAFGVWAFLLVPFQREVILTSESMVIDKREFRFSEIDYLSWSGLNTMVMTIHRTEGPTRFTLKADVAKQIELAYQDWLSRRAQS